MKKENLAAPKLKFSFHLNVCKFYNRTFFDSVFQYYSQNRSKQIEFF